MSGIRILNPLPGGATYVSQKRAQRYVRNGRADWVSPTSIQYNANDPRYNTMLMSSVASRQGYDQRGPLTLKEIRNIPVLNPEKLRR